MSQPWAAVRGPDEMREWAGPEGWGGVKQESGWSQRLGGAGLWAESDTAATVFTVGGTI